VPLRLGLDNLNHVYIPFIQDTLRWPQSIGIVGGKPRAAMYFVACQDDSLFYLDPHTVQPFVSMDTQFSTESFHMPFPRKVPITGLDPSMCLGFYCKDLPDFEDFWQRALEMSRKDNPIFAAMAEAPDYVRNEHTRDTLSVEAFEDDIVIID